MSVSSRSPTMQVRLGFGSRRLGDFDPAARPYRGPPGWPVGSSRERRARSPEPGESGPADHSGELWHSPRRHCQHGADCKGSRGEVRRRLAANRVRGAPSGRGDRGDEAAVAGAAVAGHDIVRIGVGCDVGWIRRVAGWIRGVAGWCAWVAGGQRGGGRRGVAHPCRRAPGRATRGKAPGCMGLQPGYMGLQPGRIGLQPLLHGLAASATRGCSPAVSALKLKPVSWPTITAPTSGSLATALPSAAMLVLASFESGSDNGRLNALDRATAGTYDKDLLDLGPVPCDPPRRDKRRRHHLIKRDTLKPQSGKALDVRGSALRGVIRHEDARLAQPLEHLERLDRPRQQAVLAAPEYAVAVEEEGVVVCQEGLRLC
eukprot:scaffold58784_cov90-Phaeocystis_antarctica.AAC.2